MPDTVMSPDDAADLVRRALEASDVAEGNARAVAEALVAAEIDGQKGHGLSRVASYAAQARSGKVDGHAVAQVERKAPAFLRVDAGHGFAYPALDRAIEALVPLAADTGIAAAGVTRSHHCGQLARHVERLADRGCVALMVANTPKAMAPWGGSAPLFGTNPIAFAAPRPGGAPIVIDLSLSKVARGKVMAAAKAGEAIPEGWALDADGNPTTDPNAALKGTMVPAADAKGAALALIVEILAATLTGASHSFEASSFFEAEGQPPGVGQMLIAFDSARVGGKGYGARIRALVEAIEAQEGARLPGARRLELRARALAEGLTVAPALVAEIEAIAVGSV